MRKIILLTAAIALSLIMTSCLTIEKKEYSFKLSTKEGGELTIVFHNIMSAQEDNKDVTKKDFDELIKNYMKGDKLETEYIDAKLIKKELYEESGELCGRVVYKFTKLSDVRLYQYQNKGAVMMYLSSLYEVYSSSNGEYGGEIMPVIFFKKGKKITLITKVQEPSEKTTSLLDLYNQYKHKNEQ